MKQKLFVSIATLMVGCLMSLHAQTNLTGRIYQNSNVLKAELDKAMGELDTTMDEARKEMIAKEEKEKGRKLTSAEVAKIDEKLKEAKAIADAVKKGMKTAITIEFKSEKDLVMKMKMQINDDALKAAGVGWAKRKLMLAALAVAPETQKGTYEVKNNYIYITDSSKERDTLRISNDGKYLYGKMDEKTNFTLTRIK